MDTRFDVMAGPGYRYHGDMRASSYSDIAVTGDFPKITVGVQTQPNPNPNPNPNRKTVTLTVILNRNPNS